MSKVLFDKSPLVVDTVLATKIGLNEAIVLQQVHYWIEINRTKQTNFYEDSFWTYNSMKEWNKSFPFFGEKTLNRIFKSLEKLGILKTGNFNKLRMDRTKWYTIDYSKLESYINELETNENECLEEANANGQVDQMHLPEKENASGQNDQMEADKLSKCNGSNCPNANGQNDLTNTRDFTKTSSEITTETSSSSSSKMAEAVVNNKDVIQFFEDNFYLLKRFDLEVISSWFETYDKAIIIEAMKAAKMKNIRNLTYIERLLIDWEQHGIDTPEAVKMYLSSKEKGRRDGSSQPSTFKHQGGTTSTQNEDDVTRALRKAGENTKFEDDEEYDY